MARKSYWDQTYFPQPTESEIRSRAAQTARKASIKGQTLHPVALSGRTIAKSWWGKAWCQNLEQYADFETRLPRGQKYVRSGAVVDLQIQKGKITARVQGTRRTPYKIEIRISPLSQQRCDEIMDRCTTRVDTLENLLSGSFPESMKDVFLGDGGLFPTPREISFSCSCPDWAVMCKHVAAAMYGIGLRLDEDPMEFFVLRGLDPSNFIAKAVESRVSIMLKNAKKKSRRIIDAQDVDALFGVF